MSGNITNSYFHLLLHPLNPPFGGLVASIIKVCLYYKMFFVIQNAKSPASGDLGGNKKSDSNWYISGYSIVLFTSQV
jgi:hypothetical protein